MIMVGYQQHLYTQNLACSSPNYLVLFVEVTPPLSSSVSCANVHKLHIQKKKHESSSVATSPSQPGAVTSVKAVRVIADCCLKQTSITEPRPGT